MANDVVSVSRTALEAVLSFWCDEVTVSEKARVGMPSRVGAAMRVLRDQLGAPAYDVPIPGCEGQRQTEMTREQFLSNPREAITLSEVAPVVVRDADGECCMVLYTPRLSDYL
jgi:hypothetical protein